METMNLRIILILILLASCQAACPSSCKSCNNGHVQCPGAGLDALPTHMPDGTYSIDVTHNNIVSLTGLQSLSDVQSFRMSLNHLRVIKGGDFEPFPSLVSLDLSMNSISKIYKHGFRGLSNLKSVSLNGNNIKEIGLIFRNTPALNSLRLGNNKIETVEEDNFQKNSMIKMLDLNHNKIQTIHGNAFKNLDMLRYLILSNNPISILSDLTFTSTMLSLADFSSCQLESVPRTMPPSLTDFRLGSNKIRSINVDDFQNITRLNLITLNDNDISFVEHRTFWYLENLKEMWLSRNDLVYIPRGLPKALTKLFIDNNQVVELEPMLFAEDAKLTVLSLEGNRVQKVHQDSLKYVKNLEKLNLQGNKISLIDVGTFTNLSNLHMLTLTNNPIQVFEPGSFAALEGLTELSMSYIHHRNTRQQKILQENFLNAMPNLVSIDLMSSIDLTSAFLTIFESAEGNPLDKVEKVNLQYTELTTLPEAVKNIFPNIKQLLLDGNLFHCDHKLQWLRAWMQTTTTVSFHQYEQVTCNSPHAVKGKLISELSPDDFVVEPEQQATPPSSRPHSSSDQSANDPFHLQGTNNVSAPARQSNPVSGVQVIINPRRKMPDDDGSQPLSKAERKTARKAKRERKRKEKEERKKQRQSRKRKDDDAKRKKRRIRNMRGKRCKVDKAGNMKCVRRKRCKVDDEGNVKCRKRNGKKHRKTTDITA